MPGALYYVEAFSPLPGRCFRLVAHHGEAWRTHCPEPVAWRGSWRAPNGRRYRIEACEGNRPPSAERMGAAALASRRAVPAGTQVQVHPAALPLDLIVISSRARLQDVDQQRFVLDGVHNASSSELAGPPTPKSCCRT